MSGHTDQADTQIQEHSRDSHIQLPSQYEQEEVIHVHIYVYIHTYINIYICMYGRYPPAAEFRQCWFLNPSLPGSWHMDTAALEATVLFLVLACALSLRWLRLPCLPGVQHSSTHTTLPIRDRGVHTHTELVALLWPPCRPTYIKVLMHVSQVS